MKQKLFRDRINIIVLVLIFLTTVFIWSNSLADAAQSSSVSGGLREFLMNTFGLRSFLETDFAEFIIRKLGHFSEYALLGAEYMFLKKRTAGISIFSVLFFCTSTGMVDESLQMLSDRSCEVRDVWIDFCGAVFGMIIIAVFFAVRKKLRSKKQK